MTRSRASHRESALFAVAVGVIALHATVDAFVAPEPGTQWSDHLLRGLATLAILAAAVALFPRLAAGARAASRRSIGRTRTRRSGACTRRYACGRCPRGGLDRLPPSSCRTRSLRPRSRTALALTKAGPAALPAPLRLPLRQRPRGLLDRRCPSRSRSSRHTDRAPLSSRRMLGRRTNT